MFNQMSLLTQIFMVLCFIRMHNDLVEENNTAHLNPTAHKKNLDNIKENGVYECNHKKKMAKAATKKAGVRKTKKTILKTKK